MGQLITLSADDGHTFKAYEARPSSRVIGGLVLIQEIFGVNAHIQAVADQYADDGYLVIAIPTMSRVQENVNLGYSEEDIKIGFGLKQTVEALPGSPVMKDLQAGINHAKTAGKVGIFGYCWGGLLTWRSACKLEGLSAAVAYYGGGVPNEANLKPLCPVMTHFADQDTHIPLTAVADFEKAQPQVINHIYAGQHGFNCDHRGSYDKTAADLARTRTLSFFQTHLSTSI